MDSRERSSWRAMQWFAVLASAILLPRLGAPAQQSKRLDSALLIVLNKSDHEAALVDPTTQQVLARLPTGKGPHEVATSPDGRYAYVSNYGSFGVFRPSEPQRTEPGHTVTVLDLRASPAPTVKATFELGSSTRPHGIWVSHDARRVWVTCEGAQAVLELDAATGEVLKTWKTNQQTSHMVTPTPDEKKLYVANIGSGSVSVIERASGNVTTIPTAAGSEGIAVSPDGREVWVSNRGANSLSVIDAATDRVTATFESGGQMPIRVKFTPNGKQVWVSNARSNTVSVLDAARRQLLATIDAGAVPVGIQMSPDGRQAYVANTNANQVTLIDVASRKVLRSFATGTEPDGMAWAVGR